jgi:hypothetical protein
MPTVPPLPKRLRAYALKMRKESVAERGFDAAIETVEQMHGMLESL